MNKRTPSSAAVAHRVVRVFISSTFRDMQAERDYLVKHVFPELRRRCRERAVEFVEVDLRWGVTEEQTERGEVLPICLREIELCRPYFIGLLGERYGWVPEQIEPQLMAEQPWLAEHREHSVTALEMVHGVLKNPEMASRAFFYFRSPAYVDQIPPERRADFLPEDPTAHIKLERLKARIRLSGLPLKENYPEPETAGKLILEDLWGAIDQEYPPGEIPDPLDREALEHEAFALSRAKVYIGRQEYYDRLDRHIAGDDKPLVLLGESGVGKSALLANWLLAYRENHPDDFVFFHFLGATPQSSDYVALMHRLLSEIKRRTGDPEEVPVQPDKLMEALPLWLAKASAWAGKEQKPLVLVLDALNQLEDKDHAPDLGWLPEYFPPHVRVILSTLPGRPLTALEKRGWPTFEVASLGPVEMQQVIQEYLGIYRKTLDDRLVREILAAPQAANPLYLRALLEEMRVFGVFEELRNRLGHYLTAPTPPALYTLILERLEEDYDKPRPGLVQDALSLLWAARRGLLESELLELLGTDSQPLPRAFWSPLALALEDSLVSRSGLLTFFHDYLRQAVQEHYLPTDETQKQAHLRLADYFEARELDDRKVDELPWQLHQAQAWKRLKDCLTGQEIFLSLMTDAKQYELLGYWLALKKHGHELVKAYQAALPVYQSQASSEEELAHVFDRLAAFLQLCAAYPEASSLFHRSLALLEKVLGPEHPDVAASLNNLGGVYWRQGRYSEAEPLHRRSLALTEKHLGPEHPDVGISLNNLANLYLDQGRYSEAEPLYRRSLALTEKHLGPEHPDVGISLNNLAELYRYLGEYAKAEPLYYRAIGISEKVSGPGHPDVSASLNNLGLIYRLQGRYSEAEPLYRRALAIRMQFLGTEHPEVAACLYNLADLFQAQGRLGEAEPLHQRALAIWEHALSPDHPNIAYVLNNLAVLYQDRGDFAQAEPLYRRALAIYENMLGSEHSYTAISLFNLAKILQYKGEHGESANLYKSFLATQYKVLERGGELAPETWQNMAVSHNNLAFHTEVPAWNWAGAEHHYRRSLEIWQQLGNNQETTDVELNLQTLFHLSGQPVDVARVKELTRLLEEAGDQRAEKGRKLLSELGQTE